MLAFWTSYIWFWQLAGAVIGKAGNRIKQIQAESGTMIKLDEAGVEGEVRVISITGYPEEIHYAQYLLQQAWVPLRMLVTVVLIFYPHDAMLAWVLAVVLCLSICHKSVLNRNGWTNRAGIWKLLLTYPTLSCKEIWVFTKIRVLRSGTLLKIRTWKISPWHIDRWNILSA